MTLPLCSRLLDSARALRRWCRPAGTVGGILGALLVLSGLAALPAHGQTGTIVGTVTDADTEETLPGVNVVIVGTSQGAATNAEGDYSISVEPGQYDLRASFVGYESLEKTVTVDGGEETTLNFALPPSAQQLEDLVVVGYGKQEAETVSGSISEVETEELTEVTVANNTDKLAGRVPGLVTKQTSGLPGADYRNMSIRGFGDPLVLVDGVEMRMSQIDPNAVESISVLKDASAAIYGARAGNGVILVETKRGQEGQEPRLNYSGSATAQQPISLPKHVNAGQYAELRTQAETFYERPRTFTEREVECYRTEGQAEGCGSPASWQSYDWYGAIFRRWTPQQQHNLNVQGGSDRVQYFVSGGYLNQASAFESGDNNFERWSARSNVDVNVSDHVTAALDLSFRREFRERPGQPLGSVWTQLHTAEPFLPPTLPDTNLAAVSGFSGRSPLAATKREKSGFVEDKRNWLDGRVMMEYGVPFMEGLTAKAELSYLLRADQNKSFDTSWEVGRYLPEEDTVLSEGQAGPANSTLNEFTFWQQEFLPEASIEYSNSFGPHALDGLLLVEWIDESGFNFSAARQDLLSEELPYLFVGSNEGKDNSGSASDAGRMSYVGRLNYTYDDKYILEGIFRADASHRFPEDSRWGYFPSVSAAWRIGEEGFVQDNLPAVDELKLRLSYSNAGDDDVGDFRYIRGFGIQGTPYLYGDSNPTRPIAPRGLPNPDITWRSTTQYNVGLDGRLWNGLLGVTADVFYRRITDLFGSPQADFPSTFGAELPQKNINTQDDRGFELKLTHENNIGDVSYSVSANGSFTRKKYVDWAEEDYEEEWQKRVNKLEGKWVRRTIGYVALGTFRDQEEIDQWPVNQDLQGNSTLRPGDIKYKDLDGDGKITVRDQKKIGDGSQPNVNYGLNLDAQYKGFSVSALFQGASMFDIMIGGRARGGFDNGAIPFSFHYKHRWTEDNKDAKLPAPIPEQAVNSNNGRGSSFWLKDGTYLRLKNLNVSYTLPDRWTSPLGIRSLRVYVSGTNLFTLDRLGIFSETIDPESPGFQQLRQYPPHRTIGAGVNLSL